MQISYEHCGARGTFDLPATRHAPLSCPKCGELIISVDISAAGEWIESQVARKRKLQESGRLGTRKQSPQQSDSEIDRDGSSAELAACAILCPAAFNRWKRSAEQTPGNRGRDLLRTWTGLDRPVEVKYTRYQDAKRGYLLVRPPRNTRGRMRIEYVDDAYYVLMTGEPFRHTLAGWIDRGGLLKEGELNPVPVGRGQRESLGIHWSKLRPIGELAVGVGRGSWITALGRWFADRLGD